MIDICYLCLQAHTLEISKYMKNVSLHILAIYTQVGLAWVEPRLLFNNIFDWDVRRSVKVNLDIEEMQV